MILDVSRYRICVPNIEAMMRDKSEDERYQLLSIAAVSEACPIIAVCWYVGELYGFWPKLQDLITRLKEFYRIEEIKT